MYLDALDHLAHDAVIVLRFIRIALGDDVLNFLQPRLAGAVLVDALLNCGNAAVKLLDLRRVSRSISSEPPFMPMASPMVAFMSARYVDSSSV